MVPLLALTLTSLSPPSQQLDQLASTPHQTEEWVSESLNAHTIWLEYKPWTVYGCIEKDGQEKFIKINVASRGYRELEQAKRLQNCLPVILGEKVISIPPFECLIAPYLKSVELPGGMLFDIYYLYPDQLQPLLFKVIDLMKSVVYNTLELKKAPAVNDRLFFERLRSKDLDGVSGRIETYYTGKSILGEPWEDLVQKKFQINGIFYDVTLRELIEQARSILHPDHLRPIALCHGDWTDMNICIIDGSPYFVDFDLSGENDPIGDAVVFLVYNAVQGDYLGPKYFANHFPCREKAMEVVMLQREPVQFDTSKNLITIQGGYHFGVSNSRLEAIKLFIDTYFNPLLEEIESLGFSKSEIEDRIRAALLARLLAVYDLTKVSSEDQARSLSLLIQSVCQNDEPVLSAFLRCL